LAVEVVDPGVLVEDGPALCVPGCVDEVEEGDAAGGAGGGGLVDGSVAPDVAASFPSPVDGGFILSE
jgi:hypothetical protein